MIAVLTLYVGVFVVDELGPLAVVVLVMLPSSIPILMKFTFWKKILFLIPIIILRVVGKIVLRVLGKHSFVYLIRRYRALEYHYLKAFRVITFHRDTMLQKWRDLPCTQQTYLIVIFLPLALAITLFALVIKLLRLKLIQIGVEKILGLFIGKLPIATSDDIEDKIRRLHADQRVHATSIDTEANQTTGDSPKD